MSDVSDQHQFQIPNNQDHDQSDNWTAADVEFVSNNLTGSTILDDQPHDEARWREAMLGANAEPNDPLGLTEAAADVERRQREVDFNEPETETALADLRMAAIEETANTVLNLRREFRNDQGMIHGVMAD